VSDKENEQEKPLRFKQDSTPARAQSLL